MTLTDTEQARITRLAIVGYNAYRLTRMEMGDTKAFPDFMDLEEKLQRSWLAAAYAMNEDFEKAFLDSPAVIAYT